MLTHHGRKRVDWQRQPIGSRKLEVNYFILATKYNRIITIIILDLRHTNQYYEGKMKISFIVASVNSTTRYALSYNPYIQGWGAGKFFSGSGSGCWLFFSSGSGSGSSSCFFPKWHGITAKKFKTSEIFVYFVFFQAHRLLVFFQAAPAPSSQKHPTPAPQPCLFYISWNIYTFLIVVNTPGILNVVKIVIIVDVISLNNSINRDKE